MSSPLVYKTHLRVKGSTKRVYLAAFAGGADAFAYALHKSGEFKQDPNDTTVTVTGWDGRIWWRFQGGHHLPDKPQPGNLEG
jgi:hypothetical protein